MTAMTPAEVAAEFASILADEPVAARVERRLAGERTAKADAEYAAMRAKYWPNGFPDYEATDTQGDRDAMAK